MNILRNHTFLAMAALMAEGVGSGAAAPAATAPKTETKVIHKQNGIKRPDSDSLTGKLWDIADELSKKAGSPALRKDVVDAYVKAVPGANLATAHTQYARWVTYHGATDALAKARAKAKEAKDAEKAKAKEAKDAEKAKADAEKATAKADKAAAAKK